MRRPPGTLIEASEPAYPFDGGLKLPSTAPLAEANYVVPEPTWTLVLSLKI